MPLSFSIAGIAVEALRISRFGSGDAHMKTEESAQNHEVCTTRPQIIPGGPSPSPRTVFGFIKWARDDLCTYLFPTQMQLSHNIQPISSCGNELCYEIGDEL